MFNSIHRCLGVFGCIWGCFSYHLQSMHESLPVIDHFSLNSFVYLKNCSLMALPVQ